MKNCKKGLALLLAWMLFCVLAACGGSKSPSGNSIPLPGEEAEAPVAELTPLPLAGMLNPFTGNPALEGAVDGQRPVAVMVANSPESLPQRGLSQSDVLLEAPNAVGGTSLMALYGDFRTVPPVGPVTEAEDQFVQFALPSHAVFTHIDGSAYAENLLNVLAYQDVDGIYLGPVSFGFDTVRSSSAMGNRPRETCWFTDANLIWAGVNTLGMSPVGEVRTLFRFAETSLPTGGDALDLSFTYNGTDVLTMHYNETDGNYLKTIMGVPHLDEDGAPLNFNNVLLLFCEVGTKEDGFLPDFDLTGGRGYYFAGGKLYPIRWQKGAATEPLRLIGPDGQELAVQKGKTYIGLLPKAQEAALSYMNQAQRDEARAAAEAAAAQAAAEQAAAEQAAAEAAAAEQAAAEAAAASAAAAAPPA